MPAGNNSAAAPAAAGAVAILGGAFDPPHAGHVFLARAALAELPIREVRILPNGEPRHRGVRAPWADRMAMCELAFAGIRNAAVRRDESPGTPRYAVDTVRTMRGTAPERALIFIVGADAFAGLESWRDWRELFALTHFAAAPRAGAPPLSPGLTEFCAGRFCDRPSELAAGAGKILRWEVAAPDISSSALRERLAAKGAAGMDALLSPAVLEYACERALYGS